MLRNLAFVGLSAALAFAALPARAAAIFLSCGSGADVVSLTVDTEKSTVNGLAATISATSIDWKVANQFQSPKGRETVTQYSRVDRVSGMLTTRLSVEWPGGINPGRELARTCTAGDPPPTKF